VLMGKPSRNDSFSIAMFDYLRTIHRIAFWLYQPSYELYTVYIFTGSLKPSISYCSTYV
jgi:outer membrane protein assembly factor BamE (lipoprotein component of BamABCDE complex)